MRSIPTAIIWEIFQFGRWSLLGGILYPFFLPTLLIIGMPKVEGFDLNDPGFRATHIISLLINMFIIAIAVWTAQGHPSRLFVYPIRNSTLVACHMFPAMLLASIEVFVSTLLLNWVYGLDYPLWGPTMTVAASIAASQAIGWFSEKTAWMPFLLGLFFVSLGYWYHSRFSASDPMWAHPSSVDVFAMAAVALASYCLGIAGLAQCRRGDQIKPLGILDYLIGLLDFETKLKRKFRSAAAAQYWFEWTRKGWALPAVAVFVLIGGITIWSIGNRQPAELYAFLYSGGVLLSFAGLAIGMGIGNTGTTNDSFEMGHFLASRPLSNSDYARLLLQVTAKTTVIGWGIWIGTLMMTAVIFKLAGIDLNQYSQIRDLGWWYFPGSLVACWTVIGTVTSLCLAGRTKTFARIFFGFIMVYFGTFCIAPVMLSGETLQQFFRGLAAVYGLAIIIGTVWAFALAFHRHLVNFACTVGCASFWVAVCAIIVFELHRNSIPRWDATLMGVFFVGLASLSVFPFAAAPLAISWNRTR